jgi:hypothetical protein
MKDDQICRKAKEGVSPASGLHAGILWQSVEHMVREMRMNWL